MTSLFIFLPSPLFPNPSLSSFSHSFIPSSSILPSLSSYHKIFNTGHFFCIITPLPHCLYLLFPLLPSFLIPLSSSPLFPYLHTTRYSPFYLINTFFSPSSSNSSSTLSQVCCLLFPFLRHAFHLSYLHSIRYPPFYPINTHYTSHFPHLTLSSSSSYAPSLRFSFLRPLYHLSYLHNL